jgi:hypothetical protein
MRHRLTATQMGKAIIPMTIETASLITMKISIVRQLPMQIILFMIEFSLKRFLVLKNVQNCRPL